MNPVGVWVGVFAIRLFLAFFEGQTLEADEIPVCEDFVDSITGCGDILGVVLSTFLVGSIPGLHPQLDLLNITIQTLLLVWASLEIIHKIKAIINPFGG